MGQQQLLLLVLGMVIVGIAVVAGIQAFSEGKEKADRDAAISDAMRVISDIQAWELKPVAFGGGGGDDDFSGVTFQALGIDPTDDEGDDDALYETINGCYTLTAGANATLLVQDASCTNTIATVTISTTEVSGIAWSYAT
ncbi:hypothetical protein AWN76_007435 [Rhodothermaceae bacterium RA]|nr:hypothetical protein AWN76_007435 [Rhodothermaceae bacterium RA]